MDDPRQVLRALLDGAIAAASDFSALNRAIPPVGGRTVVMAFGKAAPAMARAFARAQPPQRGGRPPEGWVVAPHGLTSDRIPQGWALLHGDHPLPGQASERAGRALLAIAEGLGPQDRLVALISGGGSAMIAVPREGLTLADKIAAGRWLLASGRPIGEVNSIRAALSAIKSGGLARAAAPAECLSFVLSDVPGDDLSCVASGPMHDRRDPIPALSAEERAALPVAVLQCLDRPAGGYAQEVPFEAIEIGSGQTALAAAAVLAGDRGLDVVDLGPGVEGEARAVARAHARLALSLADVSRPTVILSGGETTVRVTGEGRGGRNAEYALALAIELNGHARIHAIAADTDGVDGAGPPAGALVGPDTEQRLANLGVDAPSVLDRHDTHAAFEALGDAIVTGPTGTNVNDFRAILILPESLRA